MKTRIIKIYNIEPFGFKTTSIQVKEIEPGVFICRFLDVIVINEYKTTGFKVIYTNHVERFLLNGLLTLEYATKVWNEYMIKNDNPDIQISVDEVIDQ